MWRCGSVAATALLVCAAALAAEQPQGQVFRSGTHIVEVDARVFDRDGKFVDGLTIDDFEILEDGVAQPLVALTQVGARTPGTPATSGTPGTPGTPGTEPREPSEPTEPGEPGEVPPQTWIFFFDINHLTPGANFGRAREAAAAFVRDRFKDGDMAGVIDGKGMVNGRLTSVREEIVKAIEGVKPETEAQRRIADMTRSWPRLLNEDEAARINDLNRDAIEAAVRRACTDDPSACTPPRDPELEVRSKAQRVVAEAQRTSLETFRTLDALSNGLARITGPKTVVFLSEGLPINGLESGLRTIVGQAARSGARVYSVDVRGLGRAGTGDNLSQAAFNDNAGALMSFDTQQDGFNSLAVDTGGMMIRNENNFNRAFDAIAADANRYYVIGYQPSNVAFDGKYRTIEVRVKRDGLRVRARRGYLALAPAQMLAPKPLPAVAAADTAAPTADIPAPEQPSGLVETVGGEPVAPSGEAAAAGSDEAAAEADRLRPDEETRVKTLSETTGGLAAGASKEATEGWEAYQRGDLEGALPLLEKEAARPDAAPWALYVLGLTRAGLNDPNGAIEAWHRVRQGAPDYLAVYNDLAATYASQGKLTDALAMLREAEKRFPNDAEVQNGIGVILTRREAYDDAIAAFTKATQAAPDEAVTHLNLGRAYELRYMRNLRFVASQRRWIGPEGDRKKATEAYERCIALGGPYARRAAAALSRLEWNSREQK